MNDAKKIAFTKVKLKGPACIWWQSIENSELAFGHPILQWEEMKLQLKQNFLPSDYIDSLHKDTLVCNMVPILWMSIPICFESI